MFYNIFQEGANFMCGRVERVAPEAAHEAMYTGMAEVWLATVPGALAVACLRTARTNRDDITGSGEKRDIHVIYVLEAWS